MKVAHIALNTFKENVRDRVLYNLIVFALLLIAGALILGELSIGQQVKILVDVGLSAAKIFGTLMAIFIGIGLVYKELDKRTIYVIISKPVRRWEFILGKYLGLMLTLAVNLALMGAGIYLGLFYLEGDFRPEHLHLLPAIYLIFLQLMLVTALALLFSTFSTPILSSVFTFSLWLAGHFNAQLRDLADVVKSQAVGWLCNALYYLLPNFSNLGTGQADSFLRAAAHFHPFDLGALMWATLYALVYLTIVVTLAIFLFQGRDFK